MVPSRATIITPRATDSRVRPGRTRLVGSGAGIGGRVRVWLMRILHNEVGTDSRIVARICHPMTLDHNYHLSGNDMYAVSRVHARRITRTQEGKDQERTGESGSDAVDRAGLRAHHDPRDDRGRGRLRAHLLPVLLRQASTS